MDETIFNPKRAFSVGVELEIRLLDKESLKPKNNSPYIFAHLPDDLKEHVHKELLQSMVEIVTPVCDSAREAADFVADTLKRVAKIAHGDDIVLASLATHPFESKEDNKIFHDPRYEAFAKELQLVLTNFLISGLHIHIGIPGSKEAIRAYNATIKYMPIFLALSANSPFEQGEDSGLHSYRTEIFQQLPRAGIPQIFESYAEYCELIEQLKTTKTIETIRDVWWDVRIHEIFGTIELRICDAFYDYERLRLIVLFFQALLIYAVRHPVEREFYQIAKQNKWNAVRHALNGRFIDGNRVSTIRETAKELVKKITEEKIFEELDCEKDAGALMALLDQEPISQKLRMIYRKSGDLKEVIRSEIIT
jgi:carboxylate-amine ligase